MSHEQFEVGEIALIAQVGDVYTRYLNTECTVLAIDASDMYYHYKVQLCDGVELWTAHDGLRKRRPPPQREATSSWDDVIVWRPKEVARV